MPEVHRATILNAPCDTVWATLRDFNGHDRWHPAIAESRIERGRASDQVGCVRRFKLQDGSELREQLLALSDMEQAFSYCLLETPVPLLNYVAHIQLLPVTDGDRTFWGWSSRFTTLPDQRDSMISLVANDIYDAGFEAIRQELGLAA